MHFQPRFNLSDLNDRNRNTDGFNRQFDLASLDGSNRFGMNGFKTDEIRRMITIDG